MTRHFESWYWCPGSKTSIFIIAEILKKFSAFPMRCDAVQADWWKAEMQQWRTISGERDWKHRHRHHHLYISLLHIIISHHGTSYFISVRGDSHIIITSPKLPFWKVFQTSSFVAWWWKYFLNPTLNFPTEVYRCRLSESEWGSTALHGMLLVICRVFTALCRSLAIHGDDDDMKMAIRTMVEDNDKNGVRKNDWTLRQYVNVMWM